MPSKVWQRARRIHRRLLNDTFEHPTGVWFDGYTWVALGGMFIAAFFAMRDVGLTGTFGPLSLLVVVALSAFVWNIVAATRRARRRPPR